MATRSEDPHVTSLLWQYVSVPKTFVDPYAEIRPLPAETPERSDERKQDEAGHHWIESRIWLPQAQREVFSLRYSLDAFGRRAVGRQPKNPENAFIFLGGSEVFGSGQADGLTLPEMFGERFPKSQVLNLGIMGGSPSDNWKQLKDPEFQGLSDLAQVPVTLISIFHWGMLRRMSCPLSCHYPQFRWMLQRPSLHLVQGHVEDRGSFAEVGGFQYQLLEAFAKISFLNQWDVDWPNETSQDSIQLFGAILREIGANIGRSPNLQEKILVLLPPWPESSWAAVNKEARGSGWSVFDLSQFRMDRLGDAATIPYDHHLAPIGNRVMSQVLGELIEHRSELENAHLFLPPQ